jgi:hypothetical protein
MQLADIIPPTSFKDLLPGCTSHDSATVTGAVVASAFDLQPLSVATCVVVAQLTVAAVSTLALAVMGELIHSQLEVTRKVDFLSSPLMYSVAVFGGVKDLTRYGVESNPGPKCASCSNESSAPAIARSCDAAHTLNVQRGMDRRPRCLTLPERACALAASRSHRTGDRAARVYSPTHSDCGSTYCLCVCYDPSSRSRTRPHPISHHALHSLASPSLTSPVPPDGARLARGGTRRHTGTAECPRLQWLHR